MLFTYETVDSFVSNMEPGSPLLAQPTDFTLGAALEMACHRLTWNDAARDRNGMVDDWAGQHPLLGAAMQALQTSDPKMTALTDAAFLPLRTPDAGTTTEASLFLRAFTNGLKQSGFSTDLAIALAGALEGMADNVGQHSFDATHQGGGVVAFRLRQRAMAFVAADLGRGALASLRENTDWVGLQTDHDAVKAIVTKQASRRAGLGPGEGYRILFKSLANLNGELRFRSGNATFSMNGSLDYVNGAAGFSSSLPGLLISVLCRLS